MLEPIERICPVCLSSFVTHGNALHCSVVCSNKARKVQTAEDIKQYILDRVTIPDSPDACWIWHGGLTDRGYPAVCVRGRVYAGHRIAYEVFCAPIPPHAHVLHGDQCNGNRSCLNPQHLRAGSNRENMADRNALHRQMRGSRAPSARLTESDVAAILMAYHEQQQSIKSLSHTYGVSTTSINKIIYRKAWTHVLPDQYPAPVTARRHASARMPRQARNRLTEADVRHILIAYHEHGTSQNTLAQQFGVSFVTIHDVIYRKTWAHVLPGRYPPPQDNRRTVTEDDVRLMRTLHADGHD